MRDAISIIGMDLLYNNKPTKIHSIEFIPRSGKIYITLLTEDSMYVNVPYREVYRMIKKQICRL